MKKLFKKGICALLIGVFVISNINTSVKAEVIDLSLSDVNDDSTLLSETYEFKGEQKTLYVYNDASGTKMTGDIIFMTGSGTYECEYIDGYIEVPFVVSDIDIYNEYKLDYNETMIEVWYTLFLSNTGDLYNFADYRRGAETECVLPDSVPEEQWTKLSGYFTKIGGRCRLQSDNKLKTGAFSTLEEDIIDYIQLTSDTILATKTNGKKLMYRVFPISYSTDGGKHTEEILFNKITQMSERELSMSNVRIDSVVINNGGIATNVSDLTPTINGVVKSYTIGDVTISHDGDTYLLTVSSSDGDVYYDYENTAIVTDEGIITFDAISPDSNIVSDAKLNNSKTDLEFLYDAGLQPGRFNNIPVVNWNAFFKADEGISYTVNGSVVGFCIESNSSMSDGKFNYVTFDFSTNKVTIEQRESSNVTVSTNSISGAIVDNKISLNNASINNYFSFAVQQLINEGYDNISLEYNNVSDKITVTLAPEYEVMFTGMMEKNYFTSSYNALSVDSVSIKEARGDWLIVSGLNLIKGLNSSRIDASKIDELLYTYEIGGFIYGIKADKSLMQIIPCFETDGNIYYTTKMIDADVVKVSREGYLKSNGELFSFDGALIRTGIINIVDGLYVTADGTYKYNGTEFLYNYATDYNVTFDLTSRYIFDVECSDDIVSIVAPNGAMLSNGDEYVCPTAGVYLFEITNTYGDTFSKKLYVGGSTGKYVEAPIASVLNGLLYLESLENEDDDYQIQYSLDMRTWNDYSEPLECTYYDSGSMGDPEYIYYRAINEEDVSDVMSVTLDEHSPFIMNVTEKMIEANNFCGYGYIDSYGLLYDLEGYYIDDDVTAAAVYSDSYSIVHKGNEKYSKVADESETLDPFMILYDGVSKYIVGSTGNVVKSYKSGMIFGNCGIIVADKWQNDWLGEDFHSISADGMISCSAGNLNVIYNPDLDIYAKDLKYYTQKDIDSYATGVDLTGVPETEDTIISVRVIEDGFTALADNGNVYMYNALYNAMIFDDIVIKDTVFATDIGMSTSVWTNSKITVDLSASDVSELYEDEYGASADLPPYSVFDENGNEVSLNKTEISPGDYRWGFEADNGTYRINTYDEYSGDELVSYKYLKIKNVDTVKPTINSSSIKNGILTFNAVDNSGGKSAISGIDKIFYSTDNVTFSEIETGQKIRFIQSDAMALSLEYVDVDSNKVYMYASDKAGNKSDIVMFDLSIPPQIEPENPQEPSHQEPIPNTPKPEEPESSSPIPDVSNQPNKDGIDEIVDPDTGINNILNIAFSVMWIASGVAFSMVILSIPKTQRKMKSLKDE